MLLEIKDLTVTAGNKVILKKCSLGVPAGGIEVIMGPNGSGKSTLCAAIMGKSEFTVTGRMRFAGKDLSSLSPDERARLGLFLAFQNPLEIPGVSLYQLLRATLEARREKTAVTDLAERIKKHLKDLNLNEEFLNRPLNEHASGGEKKRLEMVQLGIVRPTLAILDEIDSGLDIDSLKIIAGVIRRFAKELKISFLIITHYQRLLEHLEPDRVHVMMGGKIVKSGGMKLVEELERYGYQDIKAA